MKVNIAPIKEHLSHFTVCFALYFCVIKNDVCYNRSCRFDFTIFDIFVIIIINFVLDRQGPPMLHRFHV